MSQTQPNHDQADWSPPAPRMARKSAAWRHVASEVLAERQRFRRRPQEVIAESVSRRMGRPVTLKFVLEVEKKYGRPSSPGHRPDATRHSLRPIRIKNTNKPIA